MGLQFAEQATRSVAINCILPATNKMYNNQLYNHATAYMSTKKVKEPKSMLDKKLTVVLFSRPAVLSSSRSVVQSFYYVQKTVLLINIPEIDLCCRE